MAAGVVADRPLLVAGQAGEVAQHVLDVAVGPLGPLQGGVRFVDVGLVVLIVVHAHRRLVDVGLERVVGVGKVGNQESHLGVSCSRKGSCPQPSYPNGKEARGTVSASPPVQALKPYQAGFASRPWSAGRPSRRTGRRRPRRPRRTTRRPRSAKSGAGRRASRNVVQPLRLPLETPLPARLAAVGAPSHLGNEERRAASLCTRITRRRFGICPRIAPAARHRGAARPRRTSFTFRARYRRERKSPALMLGGTCSGRPKRPPTITLDPGSARCSTRPERRISRANWRGSGRWEKVTMFCSFQISQRRIGRNGSLGFSSQKEPRGP